jgi:hypothetical protein
MGLAPLLLKTQDSPLTTDSIDEHLLLCIANAVIARCAFMILFISLFFFHEKS